MSSKKLGWKILLSGASLAAMGALSGPAFAQDNAAATDQNSDEIIVTATGRAAALQDVPVAVTAIGAGQVENTGAHDLRDLTQLAPSFDMGSGQSNSSGTIARIRGIGTGSDNPGFEGAVGIFIDGVYRARAGAALTDLPELERVEILRGPQGTLFGRNTSSGAINVVTAGPDFSPAVSADVIGGGLDERGARAMVNIPVTDSFALRFDGSVRTRDGYIHDITSDDDINTTNRWAFRGQALWDISPNATLRIIADGAATHEVCCGITPLLYGPGQGVIDAIVGGAGSVPGRVGHVPTLADPTIGSNTQSEDRNMTVTPSRGYGEDTSEQGISGQLDWDLGNNVHLTSITAGRSWQSSRDQDIDFNFIDIAYRDGLRVSFQNFSQELRLQGDFGRLNWLIGGYYGDEQLDQTDTIRLGTQANAYTNTAVLGGSGGSGYGPFELFNTHGGAVPSIFQATADVPLRGIFVANYGAVAGNALADALLADINSAGDSGWLDPAAAGSGQAHDLWNVETRNWAVFTHDELNITDRLQLTVGARYNSETKDLGANLTGATDATCDSLQAIENATNGDLAALGLSGGIVTFLDNNGASTPMNLACNPAVNTISNGVYSGSADESFWTYLASLSYHINDDTMAYASYSRGYKAGGFNVDRSGFSVFPDTTDSSSISTDQLHFDPEFTDSYEIGIRTSPFGRGSTLNLTAFYESIHDYQLNAFNGFNFITRNVPEVISKGVELESSIRPMEGLSLTAGVTYNDAYYDSEVRFNPLTASLGANDPNAVFSGQVLSFAPKWVATAGISYELPLGSSMHATFYLDGRYNTEYRTQTLSRDPLGRTDNGAYAVFNGRIGIGPRDDHWSVELWARNITDEFYYVGAFSPPLQDGTYVIFPSEPRTIGIELRGRW
jgi:outer membrane receptor protein involved in Fe transport